MGVPYRLGFHIMYIRVITKLLNSE